MKNEFAVQGDRVLIRIERNGETGLACWVSATDFARVNSINGRWVAFWSKGSSTYYVSTSIDGKMTLLHRFIMQPKSAKLYLDHRDHDGLNNTRGNLRIVTASGNGLNRRKTIPSYSGALGVFWHAGTRSWVARMQKRYLGIFRTVKDAAITVEYTRLITLGDKPSAEMREQFETASNRRIRRTSPGSILRRGIPEPKRKFIKARAGRRA